MKVAVHEDPQVIRLMAAVPSEQAETLSGWGMPDTGLLILMSSCDGRCFFCAHEEVMNMPASMVTPWPRITRWMDDAGTAGTRRMLLGGTEPTSHPQFAASLVAAQAAGVTEVSLMTSGVRLAGEGVAEQWSAWGIREVCVPLYAAEPGPHDDVVRFPGHWDAVVTGLRNARAAGMRVQVHTLAIRRTLDHLPALAAFTRTQLGARLVVSPVREKDHVFRYADEALPHAVIAEAVAGLDVSLAGFPACVAPDTPRWAPDVISLYFRGQRTAFASVCEGCTARPGCTGVVEAQLRTYGLDELSPR
jgi:pyruvate-formate lyase-activating enzyme